MLMLMRTKRRRRQLPPTTTTTTILFITAIATNHHLLHITYAQSTISSCDPCSTTSAPYIQIPNTNCKEFVQCTGGKTVQSFQCQSGLIFDISLSQCNWSTQTACGPDPVCPTDKPTNKPTKYIEPATTDTSDSGDEERSPSMTPRPRPRPPISSSTESSNLPKNNNVSDSSKSEFTDMKSIRYPHHAVIWTHITANKVPLSNIISKHNNGNTIGYYDFIRALKSMSERGYAIPIDERGTISSSGKRANWEPRVFYLGQLGINQGDAAVLGLVNIALFLSQAVRLSNDDDSVDGHDYNENTVDYTTSLLYGSYCSNNDNGIMLYHKLRTHCESFNEYLGVRAELDDRPARYPTTDFCSNPAVICSENYGTEMEWTIALFLWIDKIQSYSDGYGVDGGWKYIDQLYSFVREGMVDDNFIYEVSTLVMKGNLPSRNSITGSEADEMEYVARVRSEYFLQVLDALGLVYSKR